MINVKNKVKCINNKNHVGGFSFECALKSIAPLEMSYKLCIRFWPGNCYRCVSMCIVRRQ